MTAIFHIPHSLSGSQQLSRRAANKLIRALDVVLSRAIFRSRDDFLEVNRAVEESMRAISLPASAKTGRRKPRA